MITTEDIDPRLVIAEKRLMALISRNFGSHDLNDTRTVRAIRQYVNEFASHCRLKGIDFPKVVVMVIPEYGHLCIWPKEATFLDLQHRIKSLIIELTAHHGKQPQPAEIARAITDAYPDYGPMMGAQLHEQEAKRRLPIYDRVN